MTERTTPSVDEVQEQIIAEFETRTDWLDRYEHLIRLGKKHVAPPDGLRTDEHSLPGCQSRVWLRARRSDGPLRFDADSDSAIVRGILVLLLRTLDGRTPAEIAEAEIWFPRALGLTTNLSPARAEGLAAIIRRMRQLAA